MRPDCLVFSKDRACQLDLLLRSIDRYAPDTFASVTVLVKDSDWDFSRGYGICQSLNWKREPFDPKRRLQRLSFRSEFVRGFEQGVRRWLAEADEAVCFLVDDDVFYADAPEVTGLPWSFRPDEYWYPFTLDGGVYETERVLGLLDFPFANPTQLEAGVHARIAHAPMLVGGYVPSSEPWELRHAHGCLVGIPHNVVSVSSGMPSMGGSAAELNRVFLDGYRIDLEATVAQVDPAGSSHQEIHYVFREPVRC